MESQEASQFELDQISAINMTVAGSNTANTVLTTNSNTIPYTGYSYTVTQDSTNAIFTIPYQDPVLYTNPVAATSDMRIYTGRKGYKMFTDTLDSLINPPEDNYNFFDTITLIK